MKIENSEHEQIVLKKFSWVNTHHPIIQCYIFIFPKNSLLRILITMLWKWKNKTKRFSQFITRFFFYSKD